MLVAHFGPEDEQEDSVVGSKDIRSIGSKFANAFQCQDVLNRPNANPPVRLHDLEDRLLPLLLG